MKREYFIKTDRIGFGIWREDDLEGAFTLWGNPAVTRYISRNGKFSEREIRERLSKEIDNYTKYSIQYWPIYDLETDALIGCCGLRPHGESVFELGFHLRPEYWHQGCAAEAGKAVIRYAFDVLHADALFAGHHPDNTASANVLAKLGFTLTGSEYYEPTGLFHPSYELRREKDV